MRALSVAMVSRLGSARVRATCAKIPTASRANVRVMAVMVEHPPGPALYFKSGTTVRAVCPCGGQRHDSRRHARSVSGQIWSRCPARRSRFFGDRAGPRPCPRGGSPRRPAAVTIAVSTDQRGRRRGRCAVIWRPILALGVPATRSVGPTPDRSRVDAARHAAPQSRCGCARRRNCGTTTPTPVRWCAH